MSASNAAHYRARLRKVLQYIDANLDGDLDLDQLCEVAACSKYHFQRQFSGLLGIGVYKYVQLRRLKRAAFQLVFRPQQQVIDIALGSGYQGPEAFARAFRKNIGQSPSDFRKQPQWRPWYAIYQPLAVLRAKHMNIENAFEPVEIRQVNAIPVALLEHRGDPQLIGESIRRFIEWRKQNHLPPSRSATFNLLYDDPQTTPAAQYRLGLCAATEQPVLPNEFGVVPASIPAGRCAVMRYTGADDGLRDVVGYLYAQWLPQSGEELRDFPIYCQRIKFFPDVPENEAVIDIFLPLQ